MQLALNGAQHVRAIDIQQEAVASTLANAFRNGVADRVNGEVLDLYAYLPEEKYDVVVGEPLSDARRPFRGTDRSPTPGLLGAPTFWIT